MKGVLLVNLGSPENPTPAAVKPYLDEFLMDKYVIDVPFLFFNFIFVFFGVLKILLIDLFKGSYKKEVANNC